MSEVLEIEMEEAVYEVSFSQIQIEITGRCNMRCQHCRAASQARKDMPIGQIVKIVRFARRFADENMEVTLSGGEPFLHQNFSDVLRGVRESGADLVTLTTNGSIFKEDHLDLIEELTFRGFALSVSLDSIDSKTHDEFRVHQGAYVKALNSLHIASTRKIPGFTWSLRSSLTPQRFHEMEGLVNIARDHGCRRIGFSGIQPVGRALLRKETWMSREQKREFLIRVLELDQKYSDIDVRTGDPLQCLLARDNDIATGLENELIFGGCAAAVATFNVNSDGIMTPCAMLDASMMDVFPLNIEEMANCYKRSCFLQRMLTVKRGGKCGDCHRRFRCGGCRARSFATSGDLFGDDPHCWL